jgi:hypothetical protein
LLQYRDTGYNTETLATIQRHWLQYRDTGYNTQTLATISTVDTERRQHTQKQNTPQKTKKEEQQGSHQNRG